MVFGVFIFPGMYVYFIEILNPRVDDMLLFLKY